MKFLSVAVILTGIVLAVLSGSTYRSHRITHAAMQRNLRLQELRGTILYLDEVLTMSVRMAAATGDLAWEQRYRRYQSQLDAAIKEALGRVPQADVVTRLRKRRLPMSSWWQWRTRPLS